MSDHSKQLLDGAFLPVLDDPRILNELPKPLLMAFCRIIRPVRGSVTLNFSNSHQECRTYVPAYARRFCIICKTSVFMLPEGLKAGSDAHVVLRLQDRGVINHVISRLAHLPFFEGDVKSNFRLCGRQYWLISIVAEARLTTRLRSTVACSLPIYLVTTCRSWFGT